MIQLRFGALAAGLTLLAAAIVPAAGAAQDATPPAGSAATLYSLPGNAVFPEGIAFDPGTGYFYVGSSADGTIYRGQVDGGAVDVFSPGGSDGRTSVLGMKIDSSGRLYVCGGQTGTMFIYDTASGSLLAAFATGQNPTAINDVAITPNGDAFFTDSFSPVLYRVPAATIMAASAATPATASPVAGTPAATPGLERYLDLTGTAITYGQGFNLNGIAVTPDGRYLIVAQTNVGKLFRIDLATKAITEVNLGGVSLPGDGIRFDTRGGTTLFVVNNANASQNPQALIVPVVMSAAFSQGVPGAGFTDPALHYPTAIAQRDDRLLVVNAQFDRRQQGAPVLPFTVAEIPVPVPVAPATPAAAASPVLGATPAA